MSYIDEQGRKETTLAVVGENGVHLIDAQTVGMSKHPTPTGPANKWLRDGVFAKLGKTPTEG